MVECKKLTQTYNPKHSFNVKSPTIIVSDVSSFTGDNKKEFNVEKNENFPEKKKKKGNRRCFSPHQEGGKIKNLTIITKFDKEQSKCSKQYKSQTPKIKFLHADCEEEQLTCEYN